MPNENFADGPFADGWIEIFHSMPSWRRAFIVFRKNGGDEWCPNARYELRDASHIRKGFRVFRVRATRLEFYLTNGSSLCSENRAGQNYRIECSGRYVVSFCHLERVSDADLDECLHTLRPSDRFIELFYRCEWSHSYIVYAADGGEWRATPGARMQRVACADTDLRFVRLRARRVLFAFSNGDRLWDSNLGKNYEVGVPGKYILENGRCTYLGPADLDRLTQQSAAHHSHPGSRLSTAARA